MNQKIVLSDSDTEAVVGGRFAPAGEFKYMAIVWHINGLLVCGGSIVSESHVLTAGHCAYGKEEILHNIIVGQITLGPFPSENIHTVKEFHLHPNYVPEKFRLKPSKKGWGPVSGDRIDGYELEEEPQNDIAIVEVNESFVIGGSVAIIPLPKNPPSSPSCHRCIFAGWGVELQSLKIPSDLLKYTSLGILNRMDCAGRSCPMEKTTFCAQDWRIKSSTCTVWTRRVDQTGESLIINNSISAE